MASVLYQSIEALSRDKGIDPEIVVSAVEDAIALATRKYYKTQENMRAELDKESGEIRAYVYKTVVETPEQIEDPVNQIAPRRGPRACAGSRNGRRDPLLQADRCAGPHRRADGQAGHLPEGARGRARHGLQGIQPPHWAKS